MTNPRRLLRIYRRASALLETLDEGRQDWEARTASRKTITLYTSREWWTRALTAARDLALGVGLPADMETLVMKNWKTTLSGAAAILAVLAKVAAAGDIDWTTDGSAILAGLGLIFAKDAKGSDAPT